MQASTPSRAAVCPSHARRVCVLRQCYVRIRHCETQVEAIRQYLEREFPGQVRHTWWDEATMAPVFEVAHETGCHHVIVDMGFLRAYQDAIASLRASELADYIREARAQERRFRVCEEDGEVHIRSTAL